MKTMSGKHGVNKHLGTGIVHADGAKPKGMCWKAFYELKTEHDFRAYDGIVCSK